LLQDGNVTVGVFPEDEEASLRKAYASLEVYKARVGAQAVEHRVDAEV